MIRLRFLPLLVLAACSFARWQTFDEPDFGMSFSHPAEYVAEEPTMERFSDDGREFDVLSVVLRKGEGEAAFIQVLRTEDAGIVDILSRHADDPVPQRLDGESVRVFSVQGMGEPVSYLREAEGAFTVLTFVFPPEPAELRRVLDSVRWD